MLYAIDRVVVHDAREIDAAGGCTLANEIEDGFQARGWLRLRCPWGLPEGVVIRRVFVSDSLGSSCQQPPGGVDRESSWPEGRVAAVGEADE